MTIGSDALNQIATFIKISHLKQRYYSLDVFRGATVALMILVNNPGSWSHIYAPLEHAPWHGLTPTDLVFPFFPTLKKLFFFHREVKGTGRRNCF